MHGSALYEMRDLNRMSADDAAAVRSYLDSQRTLQQRLGAGLDQKQLRRNQRLLWAWDFMSLALCLRWDGRSVGDVPQGERAAEISFSGNSFDPWPFADETVTLRTEGRRLEGRYDAQPELHAALERAPWVAIEFRLSAL
jgi:hypothetical protein